MERNSAKEQIHDGILAAFAGKHLTFKLGKELYGLEILRVQEIIGLMDITKMPKTPLYIRGVINLRGRIIPVIDLRRKFEMEVQGDTEKTVIIVVQVSAHGKDTVMGVLVDEVSEVLDIPVAAIEETPNLGTGIETEFVRAVGKIGDKVVMLLNMDKLLLGKEFETVSSLERES